MALLPMIFSDWWEHLDRPHRILDQHFGHGLNQHDLMTPNLYPDPYLPPRHLLDHFLATELRNKNYLRPWAQSSTERGTSVLKADKHQFNVSLDVQQFKPDEISVKVVDDNVVVEGKHEEKQDEHGWVSRQFVRKYLIPVQCNKDEVKSSLSSDGVLNITIPKKCIEKTTDEKIIPIEHTGKPAIAAKETTEPKEKAEMKKPEKK